MISSSTLLKLFPRDSDYRATSTLIMSASGEQTERSTRFAVDPWQIVSTTTQSSRPNVDRGLTWLNLLACSGIDAPLDSYTHFVSALDSIGNPLEGASLLVKSMLVSFYLRPRGRHQYQRLLANFYLSLVPDLHCAIDGPDKRQMV